MRDRQAGEIRSAVTARRGEIRPRHLMGEEVGDRGLPEPLPTQHLAVQGLKRHTKPAPPSPPPTPIPPGFSFLFVLL